jgi:hypothetical protein
VCVKREKKNRKNSTLRLSQLSQHRHLPSSPPSSRFIRYNKHTTLYSDNIDPHIYVVPLDLDLSVIMNDEQEKWKQVKGVSSRF